MTVIAESMAYCDMPEKSAREITRFVPIMLPRHILACAAVLAIATPAAAQQAAPAPLTYADLVDLADGTPLVIKAQIRKQATVEPERARGLAPGHARLYIEARTSALIAGCGCENGCPTCVGPVGETGPLAKTVALRLLSMLTSEAGTELHGDAGAKAPALHEGARDVSTERLGTDTERTERRGFSPGVSWVPFYPTLWRRPFRVA